MTTTVRLKGLTFDAVTEREVAARALDGVARGEGGWVCPVNLDVLRQQARSPEVKSLVARADLVVADGMPLIWASRLAGTPLPERVAGSSLIWSLPQEAARRGASLFLLGGNPGAAEGAAAVLERRIPGLRVAGTDCPPFGFECDPEAVAAISERLDQAQPDIVFVGLGFPKQEKLIQTLRSTLPRVWFISCGISFSFVTGEVRRAPGWLQRLGLEWLHRLVQEPRRLARRYLRDGLPFVLELLVDVLARRRRLGSRQR